MMPGGRDARRGDQRRRRHDGDAQRTGGDAERARLLLGQRHHVHAPAQRDQHGGAERDRADQRQQIGDPGGGQAAEQPERHRRKLVVGVGEIFHEADAGAEQRADHDAGQHQHQDRVARTQQRADHVDGRDRDEAADEGERLDARSRRARNRCRAPRRAPRPTRRRECRATPADCETGPGTRCRRPPAPRRPARPRSRAARAPAASRSRPRAKRSAAWPVARDHSTSISSARLTG